MPENNPDDRTDDEDPVAERGAEGGIAGSWQPSEDEMPWFVVTNEPDADTDAMVSILRAAGGARGVRPHPKRIEWMQQRFEQVRRIYPADLVETLEAAEIEQMQLSAIKAYVAAARSGRLHTLSVDGVTTEHWSSGRIMWTRR